jgi:hypothetical protein
METLQTLYDFTTGDETACPIDKVYRYAAVADYPGTIEKQGPFEDLNFVMDASVQKRNTIIFAIGSTKADAKSSPVTQGAMVICGAETLAPDSASAHDIQIIKGGDATRVLEAAVYSKWFTLTPGAESSEECSVAKYELVDADGKALVSDLISYADDKLTITTDKASATAVEVFLQATTKGGVTAKKTISIAASSDPCVFEVSPDSGEPIVLDYVEAEKVNVREKLETLFKFTAQGGCAIDKVYTYASKDAAKLEAEGAFDTLDFDMNGNQGKRDYFFQIGSSTDADKSNTASGSIIVCGKETLAVADGIAAKYEASYKKTDGIKTIEKDVYSTYFALTAGDESSDKCSVAKYELVDKDGAANANDMYSYDGDKISVDTAKISDAGSSVFLRAVTKGGVKATYELAFAIAKAEACNPTVEIKTPDSDTVVVAYTDGKELDVVEALKSKFTFSARDNEDECKLDQFFIFADKDSYPGAPTSTDAMDSVKLTLDDAKKGKNEYLFSIGSTKNADKSALTTGIIFVCGLETVTATGAAQDFVVDKAGDALKTVTKADYTAWFNFEAGEKGNAGCGIESYSVEVEDGG